MNTRTLYETALQKSKTKNTYQEGVGMNNVVARLIRRNELNELQV